MSGKASASGPIARFLRDGWAVRCLAVNATGSLLDYALALLLVTRLEVMTPVGTAAGVLLGATFNFVANRRFAFRDADGPWQRQATRFAFAIGGLMLIHASAVWVLRDHLGVDFIPAKMMADVVILGASQPFVLRHLVFAPRRTLAPIPARPMKPV